MFSRESAFGFLSRLNNEQASISLVITAPGISHVIGVATVSVANEKTGEVVFNFQPHPSWFELWIKEGEFSFDEDADIPQQAKGHLGERKTARHDDKNHSRVVYFCSGAEDERFFLASRRMDRVCFSASI